MVSEIQALQVKFQDYYREWGTDLDVPADIASREFAFIYFNGNGKSFMHRHVQFKSVEELSRYLISRAPQHVYYSSGYYKTPAEVRSMQAKGWQGADLIFDVDGDHIISKDKPQAEIVAVALNETKKLVKALVEVYGFKKEQLIVRFSGNRGFHVHVMDDEAKMWDADIRKQFATDLAAQGINVDIPVTVNVFGLIRLGDSLHGLTGQRCMRVDLDTYDFFRDMDGV
jgi:DNA primase small subunit